MGEEIALYVPPIAAGMLDKRVIYRYEYLHSVSFRGDSAFTILNSTKSDNCLYFGILMLETTLSEFCIESDRVVKSSMS